MAGLIIEQMRLTPTVRRAAEAICAAFPDLVFTSGRRDVRGQARAMAANVVRYGEDWLGKTYRNRDMVEALEAWMRRNEIQTKSVGEISDGFYTVLITEQAGLLDRFPHCRGEAFDISPPRLASGEIDEAKTEAIRQVLIQQSNLHRFGLELVLTREGSHRVIHAQYNARLAPATV